MPVTEKQLKNLKPIQKGEVRNPNGAKGRKLPGLDILLAEVLGEETKGVTAALQMIQALQKKAAKGDVRAAELLMNRAYGKVKENIDLNGELIVKFKRGRD